MKLNNDSMVKDIYRKDFGKNIKLPKIMYRYHSTLRLHDGKLKEDESVCGNQD
ncbi:MAG: hypothetical protein SOT27_00790 [Helicobacter sp.]|nr:hypothetical protein [Helicobacter sp.]MDY2822792.1 hypothetical protein [Helicobacter sp.]